MQHRDGDAGEVPVQVHAPPIWAIALVGQVFPEIRSGLGQQVGPVAQRQVAIPVASERAGEILSRLQVALDLFDSQGPAGPSAQGC